MKEIVLATHNPGKVDALKYLLGKEKIVLSLANLEIKLDVVEDDETFEGNALKKAKRVYELTGKSCMADDTGLCIEAFSGWPGVETARFLGKEATQEERNQYILERMKDLPKQQRKAKVVTAIAFINEKGAQKVVTKQVDGYIAFQARGDKGFGFDPIFALESGKTLAELTNCEREEVSLRKKAIQELKEYMGE